MPSVSEPIFWLIVMAVLLIIEIATLGLTTIWFVGGAILALIASLAGVDFAIQSVLFFSVSLLLLFTVRPSVLKKFNSKREKTNIDSIVGIKCKVIEKIDNFNGTGVVIADGKEWTARSDQDQIIEIGTQVVVVRISGVKLIVTNESHEISSNIKEE